MAIKKDLTNKLDVLVDYINENTEEGGTWMTLTYRDIARIVGTTPGSSVTKRLMESLKDHENVLFKLNLDPSKSKKPLQFQFVSKETKYKAIDNKRYQSLTEGELEAIKEKLGYREHDELYNILSYLNYLKTMHGDAWFKMPPVEELSDALVILEQDVKWMNEFLINRKLLVDENGNYKLFLSHADVRTKTDANEDNIDVDKPIKSNTATVPQHIRNKPPEEAIMTFLSQLENQQSSLRSYIESEILGKISETERLKKDLDEGHKVIQKVLDENHQIRDEKSELESRLMKLEMKYDKSIRFKDDFVGAAQEFLQIFNWQIQQVALEDSNVSPSSKNSKAYRANLFQQYVDVGQEFYENIIGFVKD